MRKTKIEGFEMPQPSRNTGVNNKTISDLASAINNLADAIRSHAESANSVSKFVPQVRFSESKFSSENFSNILSGLSDVDILIEIGKWAHQKYPKFNSAIDADTGLDEIAGGDPGAFVSSYQSLDNWPPFHSRGLNLGPNELRHLRKVKDLVVMIGWGLSHHA
jgi:hypothetical protein